MTKTASTILDAISVTLAIMDTTTTILTWVAWHKLFSRSFVIFVVLEGFVQFFNFLLCCNTTNKKFHHYLFYLLPPLVPYLMWAESSSSNGHDWLRDKREAYHGFNVNTWMESFPQTIIQIIIMVKYKEQATTLIPLVSLVTSLCSIFFRVAIFSFGERWFVYSQHLPTFLFNLLCFFSDGFGLFSIISWLCYSLTSSTPSSYNSAATTTVVYRIPYLAPHVNFLSPFTVAFVVLVLVATVVIGVVGTIPTLCRNRRHSCRRCILASIFDLVPKLAIWLPFSAAAQCMTLTLLPLDILQTNRWGDDTIIEFLNQSPSQHDLRLRLKVLREYGNNTDSSKNESNNDIDIDVDEGAEDRLIRSGCCCCPLLWKFENDLKKKWEIFNDNWALFGFRIFLVFWTLRATYNFSYPIIMLAAASSSSTNTLHHLSLQNNNYQLQFSLTIVYLIFNVFLLSLIPSVVRHNRLSYLIPTRQYTKDISAVESSYQRHRKRRAGYNITALAIYIANSRSLTTTPSSSSLSSTTTTSLDDHIINLLPHILDFADLAPKQMVKQKDQDHTQHEQQQGHIVKNLGNLVAQFFTSKTLSKFIHEVSHTSHLTKQEANDPKNPLVSERNGQWHIRHEFNEKEDDNENESENGQQQYQQQLQLDILKNHN